MNIIYAFFPSNCNIFFSGTTTTNASATSTTFDHVSSNTAADKSQSSVPHEKMSGPGRS